jgi:hypothetical protein
MNPMASVAATITGYPKMTLREDRNDLEAMPKTGRMRM